MTHIPFLLLSCLLISLSHAQFGMSLSEKRKNHRTELRQKIREEQPPPNPPTDEFTLIQYETGLGPMAAYLSVHPKQEKKHPAIIWLTGGFPTSSPGSGIWTSPDFENEQSAQIFRKSNIVMMFPFLRGCGGNPGFQESFYSEVLDIQSAHKALANMDHIDPSRIYLGGHSTGGTLALLTAASTDEFAGIIALGPTHDDYGPDKAPYLWNRKERYLRWPVEHLSSIKTPTYVIEGESGNLNSLNLLSHRTNNPRLKFITVKKADHFQVIHPVNALFAAAINKSKNGQLTIDPKTLESSYLVDRKRRRESRDLQILAQLRAKGIDLTKPKSVSFFLLSHDKESFYPLAKETALNYFKPSQIQTIDRPDGSSYYLLKFSRTLDLSKVKDIHQNSRTLSLLAAKHQVFYNAWTIE